MHPLTHTHPANHDLSCIPSHTHIVLTMIYHASPHTQGKQIGTQDLEEMGQCFCTALHHLETQPSLEGPSDKEDNGTAQNKRAAKQPKMSDSESERYIIIVT